jgi:CRP-like cAMP-binding protein
MSADQVCLAPDLLDSVRAVATPRRYRAGATIFAVGDPAGALLVLLDGDVRIEGPGGQDVAVDGRGAIFGELAALEARPRSATAVAATDVDLLAVAPAHLDELLGAVPRLAALVHDVAGRRDRSAAWTGTIASATCPAEELARWVIARGSVDAPMGAIAADLGVSLELVTRAIDHLVAVDALTVDRGQVRIRSHEALAEAAAPPG